MSSVVTNPTNAANAGEAVKETALPTAPPAKPMDVLTQAVATRLTQETVADLEDANQVFGAKNSSGGTPIVITPKRTGKTNTLALVLGIGMAFTALFLSQIPVLGEAIQPIIFSGFGIVTFWPIMLGLLTWGIYPLVVLKIPSGVYAMMTKHGRFVGIYDAGKHILPPWYRVAYMVTRQSTSYNAPVKDCPTADNVMVKIDLLLVFHVEDPEKFVYKLGAEKFGDLLASTAEEAIRGLVRGTTHDHAYELRGKGADQMIGSLNEIFTDYGIKFSSASITNVVLPGELSHALENQTVFQAKKREQEKQQEYEMKVLNDKEALARNELDKKNERLEADEQANKKRQAIMKETAEVEAQKLKRLAEINAEQRANVMSIEAEGKRRASELEAEAMSIKAEAEGKAAQDLVKVRLFELENKRLEVLACLAANGRVVISGNNGDNLLAQITAAGQSKDIYGLAALKEHTAESADNLATLAS
ncbi:MAG: SPFH domain-containing protein [Acidobacteriota bacterium]|nr:SPFH domain-containing protein [Acidobacteriota bacterium]